MMNGDTFRIGLLFYLSIFASGHGHHHGEVSNTHGDLLSGVNIECNTHDIKVTVSTGENGFHGMIYPKGLSKNSSCLAEYSHANSNNIVYRLPLRSCNTMNHDLGENAVEFFNTILIQPHSKLVTSSGRGFHVRCRYEMNSTVHTHSDANSPVKKKDSAPLPNCHMKIFKGRMDDHVIAENVKLGDFLTLAIILDDPENTYGIKVTNCLVRDGLNDSEEPIINNEGCPINEDIVGAFDYSKNLTMATVTYPAHKFPITNSIYYQCNVKLCLKRGGCEDVPPVCDKTGQNVRLHRRKRQSQTGSLDDLRLSDEDLRDKSVEVYSGLLVNEVDEEVEIERPSSLPSQSEEDFCLSTRKFAIGIAIAGILLMLAVIFLVACIIFRRRRRKGTSTTGSSIYSGPYSNHAYSRD